MGAEPYGYIGYETNIEAARQKQRAREFQAGRYYLVTPFPEFPADLEAPTAALSHRSIAEVMEGMDENGTRALLDIESIRDIDHAASARSDAGQMQFCPAFPLARLRSCRSIRDRTTDAAND
jgi:hypothetical protein